MTNQIPSGLQPIDDIQLEQMVEQAIKDHTAKGDSFTAYGVTLELRQANPTLDIRHAENMNYGTVGVREMVHDFMASWPGYEAHITNINGNDTLMYSPIPTVTIPARPVVVPPPALPPVETAKPSILKQIAAKVGIQLGFDDDEAL